MTDLAPLFNCTLFPACPFSIFRKCRFHDGLMRLVGFYSVYSPAPIGASIEHSAIIRAMKPSSGSASLAKTNWPT